MVAAKEIERIGSKYHLLRPGMNERMRRQWAAAEAQEYGWGGVSATARATGLSRTTITAGLAELCLPESQRLSEATRIRRPGAGRPPLVRTDPELPEILETLIEPGTRGDPQSPLRWRCKSTQKLAEALRARGHRISPRTVAALLQTAGYRLQANRKTHEGSSHPDRNAQCEYLNAQVRHALDHGQPAISVDTKKKELVGDFANGGREWRPKGHPEEVRMHDFADKTLGRAIPYGVYDILNNQGWVSVGIDHDTAQFAANSIRLCWHRMGSDRFPQARSLLITAGGGNSSRSRLWKVALQDLADELQLKLQVCHLPPGTSKWNKIEHRLFSFITQNWRGRPLLSREVIVNLIAATTTRQGLSVQAALDSRKYDTAIQVSDDHMAQIRLAPAEFHGDWNYCIMPHRRKCSVN
jgi:hypothetical protein